MHAERQFIILDVRGDGRITERAELFVIEFLHRVDELAARRLAQAGRVRHVEHRIALTAEEHPLMVAGEETIAPITGLQGLTAPAAGEHNERGQVVILAAKPVTEPGADGRPPGLLMAGAQEGDRRIVIDRFRKHRADDRDFIHDAADVREQLSQLNAAFSIVFEWIGRADTQKRLLAGSHARDTLAHAHARREFFAGHLAKLWLRIEQVEVRRRAGLEEVDDASGLRREVERGQRAFRLR